MRSVGLVPQKFTQSGWASCTADVLRDLAGTPKEQKWGDAYSAFGGGREGEGLRGPGRCVAWVRIDTMLNTFIKPLQDFADAQSRVHCSLNLNTETGRLSSRRPNLQNQPALDKDQYLITESLQGQGRLFFHCC